MIEKINKVEIDNIYSIINSKKVSVNLIKGILKLDTIGDMGKLQYNLLLLLFQQIEDTKGNAARVN